ncbi:MAG: hypothetical protein R3B54_09220 [Bdellovibrionota bacterium]
MRGFVEAKDKDDQSLYTDALDESRSNLERQVAKAEFDRRKALNKQKFEDFKNMRSDLVQYYGGSTDSLSHPNWSKWDDNKKKEEMKKAATGFATLLGTVSDLGPLKERKTKEGLYDQQLGTAAELAEMIRKGEISIPEGKSGWDDVVFKRSSDKPTGDAPKDAFKKQFILDYLKVHGDNLKFEACVDAVNAGPSNGKFEECKKYLNDNYSGANLQDYINTKLGGDDKDKVQAARTVVATGLKKDGNAYVMDVDVADTNAVHLTDPATGKPLADQAAATKLPRGIRLVVGKEGDKPEDIVGQVLASLEHFAQDKSPAGDTFSPEAFRGTGWEEKKPRGRLDSIGLVAANQPVERAKVAQVYYTNEGDDLKNWSAAGLKYDEPPKVKKADLAVPADRKPVWLPVDPKTVTPPPKTETTPGKVTLATFPTAKAADATRITQAITSNAKACAKCHNSSQTAQMPPIPDLAGLNTQMRESGEDPAALMTRMVKKTALTPQEKTALEASLLQFVQAGNQ